MASLSNFDGLHSTHNEAKIFLHFNDLNFLLTDFAIDLGHITEKNFIRILDAEYDKEKRAILFQAEILEYNMN